MTNSAATHEDASRIKKEQARLLPPEVEDPRPEPEASLPSNLEDLTPADVQRMTPAQRLALQRTIGNRAVARLLDPRQVEEEEEEIEGPREQREDPDEMAIPGPREMRGATATAAPPVPERESFDSDRGLRVAGLGTTSDAFNVDGEGGYGWDRPMSASDVNIVVRYLVNQGDIYEGNRIVILSGTHGTSTGNLVDTGAAGFVGEDQATADAVMADPNTPEGTQIEVIDVHSYAGREELVNVMEMTDIIRVFAWCYSKRSWGNRASIKSNWWSAPDSL